MACEASESVVSGSPYSVTEVAGHAATGLDDFTGETEFHVEGQGQHHMVTGIGALGDNSVRFYEKDSDHEGRDVRIWTITRETIGFSAQHSAAI